MHSDYLVRSFGRRCNFSNRNRRSVGRQNSVFAGYCIQFFKNLLFNIKIFCRRFDNQSAILQIFEIRRRFDSSENLVFIFFRNRFFFYETVKAFADILQTAFDIILLNVAHHDIKIVACGGLSDAVTHRSRSDYSDNFTH